MWLCCLCIDLGETSFPFYRAAGACVFAARGSRERLAAGAGIGEVFSSRIIENSQR